MADTNEVIGTLLGVDGATACAIVDSDSGMVLGKEGKGVDLDLAAAGNTEVVKAKLQTMQSLDLDETIDDILITLETQYHIICLLPSKPSVFIYLVLDKAKSNLALARIKANDSAQALEL